MCACACVLCMCVPGPVCVPQSVCHRHYQIAHGHQRGLNLSEHSGPHYLWKLWSEEMKKTKNGCHATRTPQQACYTIPALMKEYGNAEELIDSMISPKEGFWRKDSTEIFI